MKSSRSRRKLNRAFAREPSVSLGELSVCGNRQRMWQSALKQGSAFISNQEQRPKLNSAKGDERIANASDGFCTCIEQDVLLFERHRQKFDK